MGVAMGKMQGTSMRITRLYPHALWDTEKLVVIVYDVRQ